MTPKIEIFDQKFAHFGNFEGSFLTILGVKKVVFWTFSKLFWSRLGSVWASFSVLGGVLSLLWGPAEALLNFDYASPDSLLV